MLLKQILRRRKANHGLSLKQIFLINFDGKVPRRVMKKDSPIYDYSVILFLFLPMKQERSTSLW